MAYRIQTAEPAHMPAVGALFSSYATMLETQFGMPPEMHKIGEEIAQLPGAYAPPDGALLVANDAADRTVGCVALRRWSEGVSELKRLFVAPEARGHGLGQALMDAMLRHARDLAYRRLIIDTNRAMTGPIGLYRAMGFEEIAPYNDMPPERIIFFGIDL